MLTVLLAEGIEGVYGDPPRPPTLGQAVHFGAGLGNPPPYFGVGQHKKTCFKSDLDGL